MESKDALAALKARRAAGRAVASEPSAAPDVRAEPVEGEEQIATETITRLAWKWECTGAWCLSESFKSTSFQNSQIKIIKHIFIF